MRLKPKTRLGLVIGIIVCTILFIGYLFLFHSEKHSITHYKEVLIEFFSKKKEIPRVPIPAIENEASIGSKPNTTEEIDTNTSTGEIEGVKEISDTKKGLDTLRKEKIKNYFKQ